MCFLLLVLALHGGSSGQVYTTASTVSYSPASYETIHLPAHTATLYSATTPNLATITYGLGEVGGTGIGCGTSASGEGSPSVVIGTSTQ